MPMTGALSAQATALNKELNMDRYYDYDAYCADNEHKCSEECRMYCENCYTAICRDYDLIREQELDLCPDCADCA